jgi:zinc transporter ZupT
VTKEAALAAAATLVAAAFTLSTFDRWLAHRRRHEAAWTIALAMFTIASASLWVAAAVGWTDPTFRVFYLFGAILNVPWLALGTIELLGGVRWGRPSVAVVGLLSAFAAGVMAVTPFDGAVPADDLPKGSDVLGPLPRILAAVCSGGAALIIIGGALWSAWRLLRGRRRAGSAGAPVEPGRLALGNVIIAVGTLILSASGTLNARLGAETAFAVTLVAGVAVLFVGFLVATSASAARPSRVSRPPVSALWRTPAPTDPL